MITQTSVQSLEDQINGVHEIERRLQEEHIDATGRRCVPVRSCDLEYVLAVSCKMCGDLMDVENDEMNDSEIGPLCAICVKSPCEKCHV